MRRISDSEAYDIAVAIEVNHGPVVESLCEQGFMVYSINPKQLDRFRDRFCVSGAKDDRKDALVLASALRTDRSHFRRIEPQDSNVIILREFNRIREELVSERIRCVNRLRALLWRYYPQFGELLGSAVRPWHLELWELMPCPEAPKRKRVSTVQNPLRRNRVKRIDAIEHIRTIIERMKVVDVSSRRPGTLLGGLLRP